MNCVICHLPPSSPHTRCTLCVCVLAAPCGLWNFPDQGSNPHHPQWKHEVLTPGSPRNSLGVLLIHLLQLATLSLLHLWPSPDPPSHLHLANSHFPRMEVYLLQAFFLNLKEEYHLSHFIFQSGMKQPAPLPGFQPEADPVSPYSKSFVYNLGHIIPRFLLLFSH